MTEETNLTDYTVIVVVHSNGEVESMGVHVRAEGPEPAAQRAAYTIAHMIQEDSGVPFDDDPRGLFVAAVFEGRVDPIPLEGDFADDEGGDEAADATGA